MAIIDIPVWIDETPASWEPKTAPLMTKWAEVTLLRYFHGRPYRQDRSKLLERQTSIWPLWDVVFHKITSILLEGVATNKTILIFDDSFQLII